MPPDTFPVSVVIPAFNRPEMTQRAVLSALGQRPAPPAEVIVVDDGSTDETARAAADAGATVVRHEQNRGEAEARNSGIRAATQPWIGLLDSDDEWLPHLLATLWPLRDDHVLVAGSAVRRDARSGRVRYAGPPGARMRVLRSPVALVYPENFITNSGVLVRADALRSVGGYRPEVKFGADLDLWLRILEVGTGIMTPAVVADYHVHEGQVTQERRAMACSQLQLLQSYAGRPWWSWTRLEAWRGAAGWDELRRRLSEGSRLRSSAAAIFLASHPVRLFGAVGLLLHRHQMRRQTARLSDVASLR